jgi:hypothetical protein
MLRDNYKGTTFTLKIETGAFSSETSEIVHNHTHTVNISEDD